MKNLQGNNILFFSVLLSCLLQNFLQAEKLSPQLFEGCLLRMKKITPTSNGSAPVFELLFETDEFKKTPCAPNEGWGKNGYIFCYDEKVVKGSHVAFGKTNQIEDVVYYMCIGTHPILQVSDSKADFLKRFIFFKFTAVADKGGWFYERKLNNFMAALDIETGLLFSYGMPSAYEKILGGNFIPSQWIAYEEAENTRNNGLAFYHYDPIGYVGDKQHEVYGVKTNVYIYDWWSKSVKNGNTIKNVLKNRFMPRMSSEASADTSLRNQNIPIRSPYRNIHR